MASGQQARCTRSHTCVYTHIWWTVAPSIQFNGWFCPLPGLVPNPPSESYPSPSLGHTWARGCLGKWTPSDLLQSQASWEALGTWRYSWGHEAAWPAWLRALGSTGSSGRGQGLHGGGQRKEGQPGITTGCPQFLGVCPFPHVCYTTSQHGKSSRAGCVWSNPLISHWASPEPESDRCLLAG